MCKYCDINVKNIQKRSGYYSSSTFAEADKYIVDGEYEACGLAIYNDRYVIRLTGSDETFSDPIKYCPFCGRELKFQR